MSTDFRALSIELLRELERVPIVVLGEFAPNSFFVVLRARDVLAHSEEGSR